MSIRMTVMARICPCGKGIARAVSVDCIFGMTEYDYTVIDCPECRELYDFVVVQDKYFNTDFMFQKKTKESAEGSELS